MSDEDLRDVRRQAVELKMLFLGDFAGRVCPECVNELWDSQARLFCGTVEETEQSE